MIRELHLQGVGPVPEMSLSFADRLNLFTGDNGLGKTFLLDVVWWALTRTWVKGQVWPRLGEIRNCLRKSVIICRVVLVRQKNLPQATFISLIRIVTSPTNGATTVLHHHGLTAAKERRPYSIL
ncbi:MAG: AAA family ATPase [Chlorobiaceae bacterium]|nr:AAA family ATPase [Chlorobiaceae bacterium]